MNKCEQDEIKRAEAKGWVYIGSRMFMNQRAGTFPVYEVYENIKY